jgi:hypothetical protein
MMKNSIHLIATIAIAYLFTFFSMDWWSVMLAAALTGLIIPLKGFKVFAIPFLSILIFWSVYAFVLSNGNDFRLSKQIGVLLGIGEQPYLVILITGIIGGLAAGVAGIFGKQLSNLKSKS